MSSIIQALQKAQSGHQNHPNATSFSDVDAAETSTGRVPTNKWLWCSVVALLLINSGLLALLTYNVLLPTQLKPVAISANHESDNLTPMVQRLAEQMANQQAILQQIEISLQQLRNNHANAGNKIDAVAVAEVFPVGSTQNLSSNSKHTPNTSVTHSDLGNLLWLNNTTPFEQGPDELKKLFSPAKISGQVYNKNNPNQSFVIFDNKPLQAGSTLANNQIVVKHIEQSTLYLQYQDAVYAVTLKLN